MLSSLVSIDTFEMCTNALLSQRKCLKSLNPSNLLDIRDGTQEG